MKTLRDKTVACVAIGAALCAAVIAVDAISNPAHAYAQRTRSCTGPHTAAEMGDKMWKCVGDGMEVTIKPGKIYHIHLHCFTTDKQEGWVNAALIENADGISWSRHADANKKSVWFEVSHTHTRHVTFEVRCRAP